MYKCLKLYQLSIIKKIKKDYQKAHDFQAFQVTYFGIFIS